jgi:uncharacterized protein (DUF1697 family)
MTRQIALIRALNVGSHHRLTMPELGQAFENAGFTNVVTYLQSGNVIFDTPEIIASIIITQFLARKFMMELAVIMTSPVQLRQIMKACPLPGESTHWHVTLLASTPTPDQRVAVPSRVGSDSWAILDRTVYVHCPNGYGKTKLTNAYFERQFGTIATTRNWNTLMALSKA